MLLSRKKNFEESHFCGFRYERGCFQTLSSVFIGTVSSIGTSSNENVVFVNVEHPRATAALFLSKMLNFLDAFLLYTRLTSHLHITMF